MQLLAYLPMVGRHPTEAPNDGGYQVDKLCKGGKEQVGFLEVSGVFSCFFSLGGVWLGRSVLFYDLFVRGVMYSTLLMSQGVFFDYKK